MLAPHEKYSVAAECTDGAEAVAAIRNKQLDVVFLDIRMPELDGFQVLDALNAGALPAIVFVTAFDDYLLKAFDVNALDYLLKPFDRARFENTLARIEALVASRDQRRISDEMREFLSRLPASAASQYADRFAVKSAGDIYFVRTEEIDWIDSAGNYIALHAAGRKHLVRESINS